MGLLSDERNLTACIFLGLLEVKLLKVYDIAILNHFKTDFLWGNIQSPCNLSVVGGR